MKELIEKLKTDDTFAQKTANRLAEADTIDEIANIMAAVATESGIKTEASELKKALKQSSTPAKIDDSLSEGVMIVYSNYVIIN